MSVVRIVLQFVLLALSSLGISTLMEWYKKTVRKDQASVTEVRIVAGVVSAIVAVIFKLTGLFTPVISAIWPTVAAWVDVILYAAVIYLLQLFGDMQIVKNVIKYVADKLLESDKLTAEIKQMIKDFETTSKFSAKDVAKALLLAGITEEKVKEAMVKVGLSEEKAAEIIKAYEEAMAEVSSKL